MSSTSHTNSRGRIKSGKVGAGSTSSELAGRSCSGTESSSDSSSSATSSVESLPTGNYVYFLGVCMQQPVLPRCAVFRDTMSNGKGTETACSVCNSTSKKTQMRVGRLHLVPSDAAAVSSSEENKKHGAEKGAKNGKKASGSKTRPSKWEAKEVDNVAQIAAALLSRSVGGSQARVSQKASSPANNDWSIKNYNDVLHLLESALPDEGGTDFKAARHGIPEVPSFMAYNTISSRLLNKPSRQCVAQFLPKKYFSSMAEIQWGTLKARFASTDMLNVEEDAFVAAQLLGMIIFTDRLKDLVDADGGTSSSSPSSGKVAADVKDVSYPVSINGHKLRGLRDENSVRKFFTDTGVVNDDTTTPYDVNIPPKSTNIFRKIRNAMAHQNVTAESRQLDRHRVVETRYIAIADEHRTVLRLTLLQFFRLCKIATEVLAEYKHVDKLIIPEAQSQQTSAPGSNQVGHGGATASAPPPMYNEASALNDQFRQLHVGGGGRGQSKQEGRNNGDRRRDMGSANQANDRRGEHHHEQQQQQRHYHNHHFDHNQPPRRQHPSHDDDQHRQLPHRQHHHHQNAQHQRDGRSQSYVPEHDARDRGPQSRHDDYDGGRRGSFRGFGRGWGRGRGNNY